MAAHALSMQLKRERDMLELLLFRLDVQQLLVAAGRSRGIHHAVTELEHVIGALPRITLSRDTLVTVVADEWGVPDAVTLKQLIAAAPSAVWQEIFTDYLVTMLALVVEIRQMEKLNQQRLLAALRHAEDTMSGQGSNTEADDVAGAEAFARLQADTAVFHTALRLTERTLHANLLEFLS